MFGYIDSLLQRAAASESTVFDVRVQVESLARSSQMPLFMLRDRSVGPRQLKWPAQCPDLQVVLTQAAGPVIHRVIRIALLANRDVLNRRSSELQVLPSGQHRTLNRVRQLA